MEEKIQNLLSCFPLNIQREEYFTHHFEHLRKCVEKELYASAYLHLHILYMLFTYIQILRVATKKKAAYKYGRIGFVPRKEKEIKDPHSPFVFSLISEKEAFRFFRIVGFDDEKINDISQLVNERNDYFHANGKFILEGEKAFNQKLNLYIKKIEKMTKYQMPFLRKIYDKLVGKYDKNFTMTNNEIELNFSNSVHSFSWRELEALARGKNDVVSLFIKKSAAE